MITHEQTRKTLRLSTLLHVVADGREGCSAYFTDCVLLALECVYTMYVFDLIYRAHVQVLNGYDETRAKRPIAFTLH